MRRLLSLWGFALTLSVCAWRDVAGGVSGNSISVEQGADEMSFVYCGTPMLVYDFGSTKFKPYVKELRTLAGENLLLDSPPDHLHHHGLMYAIRVNGTNFWEEVSGSGKERHISILCQNGSADEAGAQAQFTELLHWLAPANFRTTNSEQAAVLIEKRTIHLTVSKARAEVALRWHSSFRVGTTPVRLHGSAYNGLGLRLPPNWNGVALHSNSESIPYTAEQKWDVTAARWGTVSHADSSFSSTVALFGNPRNPGQTRLFSMNNPFAYLSIAQNLEQHPIDLAPNACFELHYLLLAYPGQKTRDFLESRYERWLNQEEGR